MENAVIQREGFVWLDVVKPTSKELKVIAQKFQLPSSSVKDCLDPEHLPKYERFGDIDFFILRAHDESAAADADTVQEITRKIAIFARSDFVITIHRRDQPYLSELRERFLTKPEAGRTDILIELLRAAVQSYEAPIDDALDQLEEFEMGVFEAQGAKPFELKQGYFLKRRGFVYRRVLRMTMDLFPRLHPAVEMTLNQIQDLKESSDGLYFYAEELTESITSLINLHLSLSANRTNEIVRVLTILSVFLLPLNVVTGIYGMNFENMPEIKSAYGYPLTLGGMTLIVTLVYLWIRKRGWL